MVRVVTSSPGGFLPVTLLAIFGTNRLSLARMLRLGRTNVEKQ
jgi:hypothetical protein